MTKKLTRVPELDAMMAKINKQFSKDLFSEQVFQWNGSISTGSSAIDEALGIGGLPRGGIVEILGQPSGGKTSLAFSTLAQEHKNRPEDSDMRDLVIDLEHTITEDFMQGFGVNTDWVIHVRPDTAEEALEIARDLPTTGKIGVVIFDSVGALETAKHKEKDMGSPDVGGVAKIMHDACRAISKIASKTNTCFIFINQITHKIGVMYGPTETSPGGNALPFYALVRLKLLSSKPEEKVPGAFKMRSIVLKNKCAEPYGSDHIETIFYYGKGPDQVLELLGIAASRGYIRHSNGQSKIRMSLDTEDWQPVTPDIEKGKDACIDYYRENPEALDNLRKLILTLKEPASE